MEKWEQDERNRTREIDRKEIRGLNLRIIWTVLVTSVSVIASLFIVYGNIIHRFDQLDAGYQVLKSNLETQETQIKDLQVKYDVLRIDVDNKQNRKN